MIRDTTRARRATALVAHTIAFALAAWVAVVNAPRTSELGTSPVDALARGLVAEGLRAWLDRAGTSLGVGVVALLTMTTLFGSAARLAVARAGVYGEGPSEAFTRALPALLHTLLARLVLAVGACVFFAITCVPLIVIALAWGEPHDARLHDLTLLGLAAPPLVALVAAKIVDDLLHASIVVHGRRPLEALVLALRALHRGAVVPGLAALLFGLGVQIVIARLVLGAHDPLAIVVASFLLLAATALVRAELLLGYARETQRHAR